MLGTNAMVDPHCLPFEFDTHHGERQTAQTYFVVGSMPTLNDVLLSALPNN